MEIIDIKLFYLMKYKLSLNEIYIYGEPKQVAYYKLNAIERIIIKKLRNTFEFDTLQYKEFV